MNNLLTALGAVIGTIGTIVATIAATLASGARDEAKDAKGQTSELKQAVEELDQRRKTMDENYKYVEFFLKNLPQYEDESTPEKAAPPAEAAAKLLSKGATSPDSRTNSIFVALSIISSANADNTGNSPVTVRATLPILLALDAHNAGAVATIDQKLQYVNHWLVFAECSEDEAVKRTAINALKTICTRAIRDNELERLHKGVISIDKVIKLYPESATERSPIRVEAMDILLQIFHLMEGEDSGIPRDCDALEPEQLKTLKELEELKRISRRRLMEGKSKAFNVLSGGKPDEVGGVILKPSEQEILQAKSVIAKTNNVMERLRESGDLLLPPSAGPGPASTPIPTLINNLKSASAPERHAARAALSLLRQQAIKPLFDELKKSPPTQNLEGDYRARLGIAIALKGMVQPVTLTTEQTTLTSELLYSTDGDTRAAAVNFFINLEDPATVRAAFNSLNSLINQNVELSYKPNQAEQRAVLNAATIIAGWGTALSDTIQWEAATQTKNAVPMKARAIERAKELSRTLNSRNYTMWVGTITRINEMVGRAENKSKAPAPRKP